MLQHITQLVCKYHVSFYFLKHFLNRFSSCHLRSHCQEKTVDLWFMWSPNKFSVLLVNKYESWFRNTSKRKYLYIYCRDLKILWKGLEISLFFMEGFPVAFFRFVTLSLDTLFFCFRNAHHRVPSCARKVFYGGKPRGTARKQGEILWFRIITVSHTNQPLLLVCCKLIT